jgi:transcriptional regulator with XRE-family HTH domain
MSINIRNKAVLEDFGVRLKELRTEKGMTQEELSYAAEVELSQVHRIETGKINPTLSTLSALANALSISLAELFKDFKH